MAKIVTEQTTRKTLIGVTSNINTYRLAITEMLDKGEVDQSLLRSIANLMLTDQAEVNGLLWED